MMGLGQHCTTLVMLRMTTHQAGEGNWTVIEDVLRLDHQHLYDLQGTPSDDVTYDDMIKEG